MKNRTGGKRSTGLQPGPPTENSDPVGRAPAKRSAWRRIAAAGIVAAGFCVVCAVIAVNLGSSIPGTRDFIEYWSAEQQLAHRANSYDRTAVLGIERAEGFQKDRPELWYSPPLDLVLALPLGFVGAKAGLILWTLFYFAALSASIWLIWRLQGCQDTLLYLWGFLFPPAIVCLQAGQISILFLLGVVLFFYFAESRPWLAGVALFPLTLKPHLFLPFGVALILWVISRRAYGVLGGFAAASGAGLALTFLIAPHAWSQYAQMMGTQDVLNHFVPTLSGTLQHLVNRKATWLQFVPEAAACGWAVWYFRSRRDRWNWMDHGLVLLLVSSVCRPYGWFFDEAVLLPAVLAGVLQASQSGRSLWPIAVAGAAALLECFRMVPMSSLLYLWTTPAWLFWYLYATGNSKSNFVAESVPTC
ncbi:MAG: DUF2029 domain-containing protein [Acidobacteriota bacterium]|nr:DUF2029 domain-containing protein [Acidobacteriota bacterium]